jgi:serine/threonine protein kinase
MNRHAALARLGLTGGEDAGAVTRAYGQRLAAVQQQLVSAQTEAEREQHQRSLSGLVEAYEYLSTTGPPARAGTEQSGATAMRDSAATPTPTFELEVNVRMETGAVLSGRLEIGPMLGQGGMGYVYAAHDRLRDEDVAIKVLRQDLIFSTGAKERFLAEAKLSSNLSHPNIVRVYDVGESGGHYYLSMERLHGHTLRQRIETSRKENRVFGLAEVTYIVRQLIDALSYAHRYIVHRDLKPENIWLADDGAVKLMDFGIARAFTTSNMTQTGMMMGTAYYMAPEQRLDAKDVDWRADQYALGVVLYELLSGTIPMGAVKPLDQIRRDVPQRYSRAVMRAMSPKREDRWPSLAALLAELEPPAAQSNKAASWLIVGLGIAAAAAGGAYYLKNRDAGSPLAAAPALEPAASSMQASASPAPAESQSKPPSEPPPTPAASEPAKPAAEDKSSTAAAPVLIADKKEEERVSGVRPSSFQGRPAPAKETMVERVAMVSPPDTQNARRQECIAQCESADADCRGINRRGRQECMRAVGFGASSALTLAPGSQATSACAFFTEDRCTLAPDQDACLKRMRSRREECVSVRSGSFASGVQDCDSTARDGDRMCLAELRDCQSAC